MKCFGRLSWASSSHSFWLLLLAQMTRQTRLVPVLEARFVIFYNFQSFYFIKNFIKLFEVITFTCCYFFYFLLLWKEVFFFLVRFSWKWKFGLQFWKFKNTFVEISWWFFSIWKMALLGAFTPASLYPCFDFRDSWCHITRVPGDRYNAQRCDRPRCVPKRRTTSDAWPNFGSCRWTYAFWSRAFEASLV